MKKHLRSLLALLIAAMLLCCIAMADTGPKPSAAFTLTGMPDEDYYVTPLSIKELQKLQTIEKQRDIYTDLWKEFFETIAIKERENPRCQRTHMPLHYRKHVTEFM